VNLGLSGKSTALERDAESLRSVALAGVEITKADTVQDVLFSLAGCLKERFASPGGAACLIDPDHLSVEGYLWGFGGGLRPISLLLDENLPPAGGYAQVLPREIAAHLSGCRTRASALAGPEGPPIHFQHGVAMVSVTEGAEAFGELFYLPADQKVTPEERSAVSLLAQLAVQAFRRLELVKRCELRSERLAQVMRSMQDMNDKLLKTQRLAAVGQLAAGAAHEINNPLAIISARAQLLEMRETDAAKKKGLRQMVEQIERISAILGSLMDFARPAAPRMEPMNPKDVADRVLGLMEGSLGNQGVVVTRAYEPSVPDIKADCRQVEQVLLNLMLNAQHAMEGKPGTLTVGLAYKPEMDSVVYTCADTGQGIPVENLEKIFDPFFTTKGEGKGTGLGLSTAYGIVQAHKGRITVESAPGEGAVFTVVLPRDLSGPIAQAAPAEDRRTKRRAVLVVDDEPVLLSMARRILERNGYQVFTAGTAAGALELFRKSHACIHLVILDLVLPDRDGEDILEELLAMHPGAAILICSGASQARRSRALLQKGARGFLEKPFTLETLCGAVRNALDA